MKARRTLKTRLLNFLGGAGYVVALFQWFWVVAVFLPSIIALPFVKEFVGHSETKTVQSGVVAQAGSSAVSPFVTFLAVALVVAFFLWILYSLVTKVPRSIARSGEVITHKPAVVIAPIVVRHVHLTQKEKKELPSWLILTFKFLIVCIPLCLLVFASVLELAVSFELIVTIGVVLFSWSFLLFSLQALLAKFWNVDYETVR